MLIYRPELVLVLSFSALIFIGTVLLKLPFAVPYGEEISFVDAFFTAASASTVTGLIVKDTGVDFTFFGQVVILLLIQLGGLGIMTAAGFFLFLLKKGISFGQKVNLKEFVGAVYISEVVRLIIFIVSVTLVFEFFGGLLLFFYWQAGQGFSPPLLFSSFFHSISAFCNAGFSLFPDSLASFRADAFINLLFSFLIIAGGLGFFVFEDLKRLCFGVPGKKRTRFSLHTKIVLVSSLVLIIFGASLFFFFEKENLAGFSLTEKILVSGFQSATSRTAGFATVDVGGLEKSTHFLLMFLMFVGGSPGSAAGGIKTISLVLILLFLFHRLKGKEEITIFRTAIAPEAVSRAVIIAGVAIIILLVFSLALLYTENGSFEEILFETVSAFGTVGLSAGLTARLSDYGKILVSVLMFLGRITPLCAAVILSKGRVRQKILFPEEKISLG